MCQNRRQGPAPSIAAASYCCSSTWESAARKMIVPQPHVLPDHLRDERAEGVGVADDVDGVQARVAEITVHHAGVAQDLLEQGDDDHP